MYIQKLYLNIDQKRSFQQIKKIAENFLTQTTNSCPATFLTSATQKTFRETVFFAATKMSLLSRVGSLRKLSSVAECLF
jgi:hypothetical protein